jgi:hypothetical protein
VMMIVMVMVTLWSSSRRLYGVHHVTPMLD